MANFQDKAVALDASLAVHPITDDIKTKTDEAAIRQHVEFLLNMDENAMPFRPNVCVGIRRFLFEAATEHNRMIIKERIRLALRFEPRAKAEEIKVEYGTNTLEITIRFRLIETDKEFTYTSTLRRVI